MDRYFKNLDSSLSLISSRWNWKVCSLFKMKTGVNFIFLKVLSPGTYVYMGTTKQQNWLKAALCSAEIVQLFTNVYDHIWMIQPNFTRSQPGSCLWHRQIKMLWGSLLSHCIQLFSPSLLAHYPVASVFFPFLERKVGPGCEFLI